MKEQKLSRGVIFEARERATIFGNYLDGTLDVKPHAGKKITAVDIDAAIKNLNPNGCRCEVDSQIQNMIWEGAPVSSDV